MKGDGGQAADGGFDPATVSIMPSDVVTRVHLFRHGEVREFEGRVVRGQLDVALSDRGLDQNARLARWFAANESNLDALYSSDLGRCRDLADGLSAATGVRAEFERSLREQHMGSWQGRTWQDVTAVDGALVTAYWNDYVSTAPPEGEAFRDLGARIAGTWQRLAERHAGGSFGLVTHVGPIRALLCHLLGVPLEDALRFAPAVASHTSLLVSESGAVVTAFGERPWLVAEPTRRSGHRRLATPRIALSGSAGTGKTTLGRALAQRLGVPFLEEQMRARLQAGLDLHRLSMDELRALVRELWEQQKALETEAKDGFVSDRSSLDYAAFWLHYGLMEDESETAAWMDELREEAGRYDRILLFPWGVLPLEHDGVRSTNRWVQLRFQTILENLLERMARPGQIHRVPATVDLEQRIASVLAGV